MLLKQSTGDVVENETSDKLTEQNQPRWHIIGFLTLLNAVAEEASKVCQGELVHGADEGEVCYDKVEDGATGGCRPVVLTCFINGFLCHLGLLHTVLWRGDGGAGVTIYWVSKSVMEQGMDALPAIQLTCCSQAASSRSYANHHPLPIARAISSNGYMDMCVPLTKL